jgi:hypothetical protein
VTYKNPESGTPLYHTVVHTGCEAAYGEAGGELAVFDIIWDEFEGRSIKKINIEDGAIVEGEILSYYGKELENPANEPLIRAVIPTFVSDNDGDDDIDTVAAHQHPTRAREFARRRPGLTDTLEGLLLKYDGICDAWQQSGVFVYWAQGIVVVPQKIVPAVGAPQGFRVRDDLVGQGGAIPGENIFPYHTVFTYSSRVYDPSYGLSYADLGEFAQNVLDMGNTGLVDTDDLDATLIPHVSQISVDGVTITTLKGYGVVYEVTLTDPDGSDFRFAP